MKTWKIYFNTCAHTLAPGPLLTLMDNYERPFVPIVSYAWLISDGKTNIVVDTGFKDIDYYNKGRDEKRKWFINKEDGVEALLKARKLRPEDIDHVVLSHLHYDHCSNVEIFSNAAIHVAREEWLHVTSTRHRQLIPSPLFPREVFSYLVNDAWDRVSLVEKEEEIAPGVTLLPIGGHTPGTMSVLVKTQKGIAAIASDTIPLYENLEKGKPTGLFCSAHECFSAMKDLKDKSDFILPSHDPKLKETYIKNIIA